ncbi:unnamed protein product [Fusarium graminearum]|uniref:Amine oxidase domain-containing protein n=1 Tax=Gibberella zeae TaxID=5518 RepID=A0A2H3GQ18_GIBZA|nr:hypothetical protein HG531_008321 [Fusarium graminearum]PCD32336.1 hypothetical protein FGRA07_09588 [Fusarium graminearum]CAF3640669.1 unnamed protein product [Fusarium graminearum]CAG1970486.1 unnamed protein product [Fusarium graminearum]CAG2007725.1 unnamed protein product [Fusarium graminearum]
MATATLNNIKEHRLPTDSYKHMWARYVAKRAFDEDIKSASKRLVEAQKANPDLFSGKISQDMRVATILAKTQEEIGTGLVPRDSKKLDIGIIGAGVSGLFTALVFDWLNEECKDQGLKINYDIIEAGEEARLGGRLYTHRFSDAPHDYYDVGAMRFPNNTIMRRTFQLFNYLGMKPGKGGLIPYYMDDVDGVCPTYFNDVRKVGDVWTDKADDPFRINSGLEEKDKIPEIYLKTNPSKLVEAALDVLIKDTKKQFDEVREENDENGTKATALWDRLMRADKLSVRQFLSLGPNDTPSGPGYNYNTIEWLESATYGTGWYDQSLTECVLEQLDFDTPKTPKGEPKVNYWWCVDGGAQTIAQRMAKKIKNPVQYKSQVVAIDAQIPKRKEKNDYTPMKLEISNGESTKEKEYFAVFNSTTLGALQRMNLKDAGLLWGTKQAIRALGYGASCKVAIKFKTAWWQKEPFRIRKGGLAHTDLPLRVCVYPSYNIEANEGAEWDPEKPAVLLCSYTWGQDAQRMGALISSDSPKNEQQLVSVLLHDLALLHAEESGEWDYKNLLKTLKAQYQDHHAYDWYGDQNMSGAFAYFGPGQFSNMWQEIIKPNAYGQLYLVGEASSSHHAWIVGALESVIRAVYLMFEGLQKQEPDNEAYKKAVKLLSQAPQVDPKTEGGDVFGGDAGEGPLKPQTMPSGLPFYPLPEEMPDRLLDVSKDDKVLRDPLNENDEYKEGAAILLSVAMIGWSLLESYIDFELDDQKAKPQ